MIGELLGNRYEILEEIGQGGMAKVYKARCTRLNRLVAIKILRPQYADDTAFLSRFQREAEAAAALTHPNVVNVFDVGQDNGAYYMVMEYIDGKNLKELIDQRAPFTETESIRITRQIAEALEKAHGDGIVHRDIKPHNIMIAKDGRVKVTDFGIARAKTASKMTEIGVVMGSVHYFSPEQAKGENVGARSDLYSLGIIFYEMVTGRVPFDGDTPISIALKQISEKPVSPRSYKPELSIDTERIIMRLLAKNSYERYNDASELKRALDKCCPEIFIDSFDTGTMIFKPDDLETTKVMPAVNPINEPEIKKDKDDDPKMKKGSKGKKKFKLAYLLVGAMVLLGLLGVGIIGFGFMGNPEMEVPDLTGKTPEEAEAILNDMGLKCMLNGKETSDKFDENKIISQHPEGGRTVKKGRTIFIIVSLGQEKKLVPDLTGKTVSEVSDILGKDNLLIGSRIEQYNDSVPAGRVIGTIPSYGTEVKVGSKIDIIVSRGREDAMTRTPDLVGGTVNDAKTILTSTGLVLGAVKEMNSDAAPGTILQQTPAAGSKIKEGAAVQLVVSGTPKASKTTRVSVNVPAGPNRQEVKIVVEDDAGSRTIYSATHAPGDVIDKNVSVSGSGKITVYVAGAVYGEQGF